MMSVNVFNYLTMMMRGLGSGSECLLWPKMPGPLPVEDTIW